jgi:hypothetical protein
LVAFDPAAVPAKVVRDLPTVGVHQASAMARYDGDLLLLAARRLGRPRIGDSPDKSTAHTTRNDAADEFRDSSTALDAALDDAAWLRGLRLKAAWHAR